MIKCPECSGYRRADSPCIDPHECQHNIEETLRRLRTAQEERLLARPPDPAREASDQAVGRISKRRR